MFALLKKARWYRKLDLFSGYYQCPMEEKSRQYTAFTCEWGLFEYLVLPMGLTNSPATFQRMTNNILKEYIDLGIALVFLDDILIFSETLDDHIKHVRLIVERLDLHSLKINLKKCEPAKNEIIFLGHVISEGELKTDQSKVEALYMYKRPNTLRQLQSFLGLAQYYRKFVKNFSITASSLFDLISNTKDPKKLIWVEECQEAFEKIRSCLSSEKVLILPDLTQPFILDTDACNIGFGAVLGQLIDAVIRPVAYFSKHLSPAQKRYSTTEKELLAIVLSCEHFHQYLYGRSFEVFSDHQPLSWVLSNKKLNSRLA